MNTPDFTHSDLMIMSVDSAEQAVRKGFMGFAERDARILKELKPLVAKHAPGVVDHFYTNVERYPELLAVIRDAGSDIDRLKGAQQRYLLDLFSGDYGQDYFDRRLRIGAVHNRIGLTPRWYLGSYSVYAEVLIPLISRHFRWRPLKRRHAIAALNKILWLDAQLAMDTYIHGLVEDFREVSLSRDDLRTRLVEFAGLIEKVADGDLRERVRQQDEASDNGDDINQLGASLNGMTDSLAEMTGEIRDAAEQMLVSLNQVNLALNTQAAGATQQAAAVNETTSTLEEIRATTGQTLEKARALGEVAERTRLEGEQGQEAVTAAEASMDDLDERVKGIAATVLALSERTQQIGEITTVVEELSQRSKMLALNASIEAAKAGEAGKGFAVVAGEVRELAEQSQQSTAQVQKILQEIRLATDRAVMAAEEGGKGVAVGVDRVQRAGESMQALASVIHETALASQQIMAAVRQEVTGIDQVSIAMGDINQVTEQFLNSTNETKQAATGMAGLADRLSNRVDAYKL